MRLSSLALTAGLLCAAGAANAQRLDSTHMTCSEARSIVARSGAVVLSSGPYIYDRFVADRSFCAAREVTRPAFVATRDAQACLIGGRCETPDTTRMFED